MKPVLTRQPGGTPTGDRIRALVLRLSLHCLAPMGDGPDVCRPRHQPLRSSSPPSTRANRSLRPLHRLYEAVSQGGGRPSLAARTRVAPPALAPTCSPTLLCCCCPRSKLLWPAPAAATSAPKPNPPERNRFELEPGTTFYRRVWEHTARSRPRIRRRRASLKATSP